MALVINFTDQNISKGELADKLFPSSDKDIQIDCAIPQTWIDKIRNRFPDDQLESFGNIASHFVYVYDNSGKHHEEYIMPITKVGCKILGILSLY